MHGYDDKSYFLNSEVILLDEVIRELDQGFSRPFLCRSEAGDEYIVKGIQSNRRSQISEWICGNLAKILGLPIAEFSLVEVPFELWEELPKSLKGIGSGVSFGSKKVARASWFEQFNTDFVPIELQCRIIAFDLWIKNMDRNRMNPNLLYQADNDELIIIDHNNAFDHCFDFQSFVETHIFRKALSYYDDIINRSEIESCFDRALKYVDDICNTLPASWKWANLEEDLPADYDFEFMRRTLGRVKVSGELWRAI